MNKVILMGRLTKDPEVRYSQSAEPIAIARYTLAVNRRFRRENEPDADFINCTALGRAGEFAEKYFKKGMMIAVSGRLQVRTWDDQQGQRHWSTEVLIEEQDFAESKSSFESRQGRGGYAEPYAPINYNQAPPQQGYGQPQGAPGGYQQPNPGQGYGPQQSYQPAPNFPPRDNAPEGFSAISESIDDEDLPF